MRHRLNVRFIVFRMKRPQLVCEHVLQDRIFIDPQAGHEITKRTVLLGIKCATAVPSLAPRPVACGVAAEFAAKPLVSPPEPGWSRRSLLAVAAEKLLHILQRARSGSWLPKKIEAGRRTQHLAQLSRMATACSGGALPCWDRA